MKSLRALFALVLTFSVLIQFSVVADKQEACSSLCGSFMGGGGGSSMFSKSGGIHGRRSLGSKGSTSLAALQRSDLSKPQGAANWEGGRPPDCYPFCPEYCRRGNAYCPNAYADCVCGYFTKEGGSFEDDSVWNCVKPGCPLGNYGDEGIGPGRPGCTFYRCDGLIGGTVETNWLPG